MSKQDPRQELQAYHSYNCHSTQRWLKGMTEPFPCDCGLQEAADRYADQRVAEAQNRARYELHAILSDDVDSELDHSDIEQKFVAALHQQQTNSQLRREGGK